MRAFFVLMFVPQMSANKAIPCYQNKYPRYQFIFAHTALTYWVLPPDLDCFVMIRHMVHETNPTIPS